MERVISELGRFAPAEVLRGGDAAKSEELTCTLQERLSCCADLGADELFDPQETAQLVEKQFGRPLDELGLTERSGAARARCCGRSVSCRKRAFPMCGSWNSMSAAALWSWISAHGAIWS